MKEKKVALVILDGYGLRDHSFGNAVSMARQKNMEVFFNDYPNLKVPTGGKNVGIPSRRVGNSYLGHTTIGAGRVVKQGPLRINEAIEKGSLFNKKPLLNIMKTGRVHLLGYVDKNKYYADINHIIALIDKCKEQGVKDIFLHLITNKKVGEDETFLKTMKGVNIKYITSVAGYDYTADQNLIKKYLSVLTERSFIKEELKSHLKNELEKGKNEDEFRAARFNFNGDIRKGDGVIFFNHRGEKLAPFITLLKEKVDCKMCSLVPLDDSLDFLTTLYPKLNVKNNLTNILLENGKDILRVAESVKSSHITTFFDSGEKIENERLENVFIPSIHTAKMQKYPKMMAEKITEEIIEKTNGKEYDFILVNYANCDSIGHTGNLTAAIKAVECVDKEVGKLVKDLREKNYTVIITADHGNADKMLEKNLKPFYEHTSAPAPIIIIDDEKKEVKKTGKLANIAPTILEILDIPKPGQIRSGSLFKKGRKKISE